MQMIQGAHALPNHNESQFVCERLECVPLRAPQANPTRCLHAQVLTMVIDKQTRTGKKSVELSIRALEQEPGQFLADPQAYMQHAERCLEQQQQQQQ
eukprot:scaffold189392_cov17-Tisochrysis_lutea.AAC.1